MFRAMGGELGQQWASATPSVREAFSVIADAHAYRAETQGKSEVIE